MLRVAKWLPESQSKLNARIIWLCSSIVDLNIGRNAQGLQPPLVQF